MFDDTSRYHHVETARMRLADGRVVAYKRRRFLPSGAGLPLLTEVTLRDGDRLDLLAASTLGDPLQFWRICDANDAMHPDELESPPGRRVRVPLPQP